MNKSQFVVYFKSVVAFFMVTVMNFWGEKVLPLIKKQLFNFVIKWSWLRSI